MKAKVSASFSAVLAYLLFAGAATASSASEKVVHSFDGTLRHGREPMSQLVSDGTGSLYGTTNLGGDYSLGTVYSLTPNSSGGWTQKVLYSFKGGSDGWSPQAGLIFDALGNLYGTTSFGGTGACSVGTSLGCGTVFKLTPNSGGGWMESILYSLQGGNDGQEPLAGLIFDSAGNLYGTTLWGGSGTYGTVFQLKPASGVGWTESVLYGFMEGSDGENPSASLVLDAAGHLYGTTSYGGSSGYGVVFELTSNSQGIWTEAVLHSFAGGTDGATPEAPLIFDSAGNLFGTTTRGGGFFGGAGTVFELKPNGNGGWTESVLYSFGRDTGKGLYPLGLISDNAGNLYGTTTGGGTTGCYSSQGCGVVFQIVPGSGGQWTERVLHTFTGAGDGGVPYAGLIFDQGGDLYGTTGYGGLANLGAVFKLSLSGSGDWKQQTIYWFPGSDGTLPSASLVSDNSGNFYGTTQTGGLYQNGSVFRLTRSAHGGWTSTLLYSFKGGADGASPFGPLIFDSSGNLYGTTAWGGTGMCAPLAGCGTVFELATSANGKWTEKVLYSFQGDADGELPYAGLTLSHGKLFGTTTTGGGNGTGCLNYGCGVVFEMTPSSGGQWSEKVIYTFTGRSDGGEPWSGSLTADAGGNLYGTTSYTGCDGCSGHYPTVFELSPDGAGGWTQRTIYAFTDYGVPLAGVILDKAGNLYGTIDGIVYSQTSYGSVFELTSSAGAWTRSTLYSFSGGADGAYPYAGLTFDNAGNLYGTTFAGGDSSCSYPDCGVVFRLAPGSNGMWSYSVLHAFQGPTADGAEPYAGVILDGAGNLFGTTSLGGVTGNGAVFEVIP